jgi:hypothetical protein
MNRKRNLILAATATTTAEAEEEEIDEHFQKSVLAVIQSQHANGFSLVL